MEFGKKDGKKLSAFSCQFCILVLISAKICKNKKKRIFSQRCAEYRAEFRRL